MRASLEWHEPPDGTEAIKSERAAARCVCEKSRRDGETSASHYLTTNSRLRSRHHCSLAEQTEPHDHRIPGGALARTIVPHCSRQAHSYSLVSTCRQSAPPLCSSGGTLRSACSQGGVRFPTGGKGGNAKPASARRKPGSADPVQLRSRRYSPDERERDQRWLAGVRNPLGPGAGARATSRNPEETGYGKDFI
jgi:hypothetical protein